MDAAAQNILSWEEREQRGGKAPQAISLSASLIGLNWFEQTPWAITKADGTQFDITAISYDQAKSFIADHHQELFAADSINPGFMLLEKSTHKESYYRHYIDHFAINYQGQMVGYACINLQDWSTYYLRYINILPQYRGHQLVLDIMDKICQTLQHFGIERIEAHVSVGNLGQQIRMAKMGFISTGNYQSERWGSLSLLTKYLDKKYQHTFQRQFCL